MNRSKVEYSAMDDWLDGSGEGLRMDWLTWLLWGIGTTISRSSILYFYIRVFGIGKAFSTAVWVTGFLNLSWGIGALVSTCLLCIPLSDYWGENYAESRCINQLAWTLILTVTSAFVDLIILLLPVRILYRLKMSLTNRLLVGLAFLCGYGVIAFSIGRCVIVIRIILGDFSDEGMIMNNQIRIPILWPWLCLENSMFIVCACLPMMFALCRRAYSYGPSSLLTSKPSGSTPAQSPDWQAKGSTRAAIYRNDEDYEPSLSPLGKQLHSGVYQHTTVITPLGTEQGQDESNSSITDETHIFIRNEINLAFEDSYLTDWASQMRAQTQTPQTPTGRT